MPLIILCGIPSSGKSKRALEIKEYFEKEKNIKVYLVVEEDFLKNFTPAKDRNDAYNDSKAEKIIRAGVKSEVIRLVNKDNVVIVDGLNYIKGYRYELYCASKQHCSQHCIVQCVVPIDEASKWNETRDHSYSKETFDALVMRFEAPDSRNRWDSPMFSVQSHEELPLSNIYDALFSNKKVKPNQSTQLQPLSSNNFLYELDNKTQEVVSHILDYQKTMGEGDIKVPGSEDVFTIGRRVTLAELSRYRRQFITYSKSHPVRNADKLKTLFVQYLNTTLIT